jgi:hypothetical protein
MGRFIDLTNQKFGRLTVIKRIDNRKASGGQTRVMWLCKCDCGKETGVASCELKNGSTQSCGCYRKEIRGKSQLIDLIGKRFGRWTVLKKVEKPKYLKGDGAYWLCKCDCGNIKIKGRKNLLNGDSTSCGCYQKEKASKAYLKDLTGKRFGKLTVINRTENYINTFSGRVRVMWLCKCDCGKETIVASGELKRGDTKSCGCLSESFIAHEIKKYFVENYNAQTEYKIFKNPITKHYLPYDIYISKEKNPIIKNIYIEINGEQHYKLNPWHKRIAKRNNTTPEQEFQKQKHRDALKKKFAKKNGIYIEVDLRKIVSIEEAIKYIEIKESL